MTTTNEGKNPRAYFFSNNKDRAIMIVLIVLLAIIIVQAFYIFSLDKKGENKMCIAPAAARNNTPVIDWDPFAEMDRMQRDINRLFRNSLFRGGLDSGVMVLEPKASFYEPDLDIKEEKDRYVISVDVPGMQKDGISIAVREDRLSIRGDRQYEKEEISDDERFYRLERSFGAFQREIPLPGAIDKSNISAEYQRGVLTIYLPKAAHDGKQTEETKITIK